MKTIVQFLIVLVGALCGHLVFGQATDVTADLEAALGAVSQLWTVIAALLLAVALVTVGLRFFRKAVDREVRDEFGE